MLIPRRARCHLFQLTSAKIFLQVGHERSALTSARTFQALYVEPILDTIRRQNPTTEFASANSTKNGVYDTASSQTLYLFIDVKTAGSDTWSAVLRELAPLRDAGYLTTTNGTTLSSAQVTIIGTGNTPIDYFLPRDPASPESPRYTFFDGQLSTLNSTAQGNITALISPIASTSFLEQVGIVVNETLNSGQLSLLTAQVATAKSKGITARYWETPGWPIGTRNAVWRALLEAGAGLINVDDLAGAAGFWEAKG